MNALIGIIGAAILFGIFTALRPRRTGCNGHCVGCTGDSACDKDGGTQ